MTEREKLIEILLKIYEKNAHFVFYFTEDEAAMVADNLLANGVSVPSCKVGDNVYQLDSAGDIYKSEVTQVIYNTKGVAFDERTLGKSVFLTREEAEEDIVERLRRDEL